MIAFLKPNLPLFYRNGNRYFHNRKIFGASVVTLGVLGYMCEETFSYIGQITLIQIYGEDSKNPT